MLKSAFHRARHDETGMSIVEVVVASFILFFVLTAVLGLIGATTSMSIHARQRTVMVNAVASYLDYARSVPFEALELKSVDASGALESVVTTVSQGFTVTLTTTVQDGPRRTREVQISAACSAPGYPTMHTSAFAAIRDHKRGMTLLPADLGPQISFGILTPSQESVLYESSVSSSGALYVDAQASADTGLIVSMEFIADGYRLRDGDSVTAGEAYWAPGESNAYESIRWDTRQVIGETTEPAIQDGWRIVRVEAVDDQGYHAFKERRFLVDNFPPANPGAPRTMTSGWKDLTVLLNWDPAQDGTEPAYRYELRAYRDVTGASTLADWTSAGAFTLTQPAHTLVSSAFSRYFAQVRAVSPRGLTSDWMSSAAPFYSRPLLTGTGRCTITGSERTAYLAVSLNCSPANFPVAAIRYDLYRGTSLGTLALYRSNISFPYSETIVDVIGKHGSPFPYYFQIRATFTPSGWSGGTAVTISSNAVGPAPVVDDGLVATLLTEW